MKGFLNRRTDLRDRANDEIVLGDRERDSGNVDLLKRVGADDRLGDLPGQRNHRHRIEHRRGDPGDEVGRPWTRSRQADADLAGGSGVSVGRMRRALLVSHQDVVQIELWQDVVERDHGAPGISEDDLDTFSLQRLTQHSRAGLTGAWLLRLSPLSPPASSPPSS